MNFGDYLKKKNMTLHDGARFFELPNATSCRRYALGLAIPRPARIQFIFERSGGKVRPEDWYLPLEKAAE